MTDYRNLSDRINKALEFFSDKIKSSVLSHEFCPKEETYVIYLTKEADTAQFCGLLYGSGLFTENDDILVKKI